MQSHASASLWAEASRYQGTRVMVLGAAGFIGSNLSTVVVSAGAQAFLVARNRARLESMSLEPTGQGKVEVIKVDDLAAPGAVEGAIQAVGPHVIFNLCAMGVDACEADPKAAQAINRDLVFRTLRGLARVPGRGWSGARLVHAGSALEYGTEDGDLVEDGPASPTTVYGRTKLEASTGLQGLCAELGVPAVTARLFTVFGPGEAEGRLLPHLIRCSMEGRPARLTNGSQKRDFTFVGDVVEGLLRLGMAGRIEGAAVNLATGVLTTVRQFAVTAARALGMPENRLIFGAVEPRSWEMSHLPVSVARLEALTGWRPMTTVEAGIRATLKHAITQQRVWPP